MLDYANVPRSIGRVVSRWPMLLLELQTTWGAEDLYNMLEILAVDSHNEHLLNQGD